MILKQLEKDYKLNKNDLFIARYILEHSEEIPLLSSHQLAKETFTSPTAIIRFVKKLGFESYNDFKLNIHSFLNQYYLSNMHIQSHENLYSVKNKLTEIECGIIHQTKDNIDSTTFNHIISMISKNKYIDIIANDTNSTIGDYASHLLSSVNKIVNVYHNHDKQLWLSFNVERDHTIILVSKYGKNKHLLRVVDNKTGDLFLNVDANGLQVTTNSQPLYLYHAEDLAENTYTIHDKEVEYKHSDKLPQPKYKEYKTFYSYTKKPLSQLQKQWGYIYRQILDMIPDGDYTSYKVGENDRVPVTV